MGGSSKSCVETLRSATSLRNSSTSERSSSTSAFSVGDKRVLASESCVSPCLANGTPRMPKTKMKMNSLHMTAILANEALVH